MHASVRTAVFGKNVLRPPPGVSWTPFILPRRSGAGWKGHIPTGSLIPNIGDGVEYWVDPVSGSDAANGLTTGTPLKGLDAALAKTDAGIINLAPADTSDPFIYRADRWGSTNPASTKPGLIVRRWLGVREGEWNITTAAPHNGTGWTPDGTFANAYSRTQASVAAVRDTSELEASGAFKKYAPATGVEDCHNTEGSWYQTGSTLYVHALGGGAPQVNVLVFIAETNALVTSACPPLYVEGLNFLGGSRPFFMSNTLETTGYRHILKDCSFLYGTDATNGNGFHNTGMPEVLLDNCLAAYNMRDGFNFAIRTSVIPKAVLLNCIGKWNGEEAVSSGNNNGSTMHSAGTIVRIGGEYFENDGPNCADVEASMSWSVGVSAHDTRRASPSTQAADFYNSAGLMWLYQCDAANSEYSATVTSGGTTYADQFTYNSAVAGALASYHQA